MPKTKPAHNATLVKRQRQAVKQQIKRKRPAHKRILLHPLTVFFLLCAVVFLIDWTYRAFADTTISAKILAPPLTEGAVITSPKEGTIFTSQLTTTIAGTCPTDSYVSLTQNGSFSGVGLCLGDHSFHIQVTLVKGNNEFVATAYNITDQPGPATPPVHVRLELAATPAASTATVAPTASPAPVTTPVSKATPAVSATPPLLLLSAFEWQTFETNSEFSWKLDVEGGQPPYVVNVDWGDGRTSQYKFAVDPVFEVKHKYTKAGYFVIKTNSIDANGSQHMIQLAALINTPGKAATYLSNDGPAGGAQNAASVTTSSRFFIASKNWLWVAWPSLIVVLLMAFSFWLGEAQDRRVMLARRRLSHR